MYVAAVFYRKEVDAFVGREYTYKTDLPLNPGDRVICPTYKGENLAIITRINISNEEIDPAWEERIQEIQQYYDGMVTDFE